MMPVNQTIGYNGDAMQPNPPQTLRRLRLAMATAAGAAIAFSSLIWLAPLWMRAACFPICHQKVERTLAGWEGLMAVCSRCSGIYWGASAALAFAFLAVWATPSDLWRPHRRRFFIGVMPMVIDAVLPWFGLPQLSIVPRHLLAWPAGLAAGWFFALGLADLARRPALLRWRIPSEVQDG